MSKARFLQITQSDPRVDALLEKHTALMRASSPAESCHSMSADELRASHARVYALELEGQIVGVGALKPFQEQGEPAVELKSMHVDADFRGRGLAGQLLNEMLEQARQMRAHTAWLETSSGDDMFAARALYSSAGFKVCAPYGDYRPDPLSCFMTQHL